MCIMMHLVLCIDAFRLAFCTILPCVLLHFALRFAAFYLPFCCKQCCVLLQNAVCFAAKSTFFPKNRNFMHNPNALSPFTTSLFSHQTKPSRELNICNQFGSWFILMPLFKLNFVLKTLHFRLSCQLILYVVQR